MAVPSPNSASSAAQFAPASSASNAGITRRPGVFNQFVQTVSPDPTPSRFQFYKQGIGDYFAKGYVSGNVQYYQNLKKDPGMLSWVGGVTLGLGALFTMFNKFRGAVHYGAALLALVWPVMHANRTFPKMADAYQKAKDGNPTEAKAQFKKAMNDTTYNVFHVFLKPMTFAFALAFILSLPRTLRRGQQLGFIDTKIVLPILKALRIKESNPLIKGINKIFAPLERVGLRLEGRAEAKAPGLARWMQKMS